MVSLSEIEVSVKCGDQMKVAVVGAGLAGAECAYVLAQHYQIQVTLFEMKSKHPTPAQDRPDLFAELVCSNSFKSLSLSQPTGLLKAELSQLGSLVMESALKFRVPAGEALAVDRVHFSQYITQTLRSHPRIEVKDMLVPHWEFVFQQGNFDYCVIATGPLTHDSLSQSLQGLMQSTQLYFYDAIAPVIDGSTIDLDVAFWGNREKTHKKTLKSAPPLENEDLDSSGDYLNIPLTKEEYFGFVDLLIRSDKVPFHEFEEAKFFNGCQPIEVLAESGPLTLAHGPMKGRGLTDPKTGRWPFAAIQLRKEQLGHDSFNMVGFQTRLTWTAQKDVFRTLPGMKEAAFFRMGSMHRNTYVVAPSVLNEDLSLKQHPKILLAGQIMGVEGYLESAAMGVYQGHLLGMRWKQPGRGWSHAPRPTAIGALVHTLLHSKPEQFCPININWGLFPDLPQESPGTSAKRDKATKRALLSELAQKSFQNWVAKLELNFR